MEKLIIIIGAGLTGLATGCYGRMNGYRTSIFEMHNIAGGVCTGWKRKGYTIDGAMNWLMGTKPVNPGVGVYKYWEELGAAQHWQIFDHDRFMTFEDGTGNAFSLYSDIDRLERQMIEISPEDEGMIHEITDAVRDFARYDLSQDKPQELYNMLDYLKAVKMFPFLMFMRKWGKVSVADYIKRFKSPLLRRIISLDEDVTQITSSALGIPLVLAFLNQQTAGYVIGGSLALVSYIQQRYLDLGGELHLKLRVEKVLVENDKAVGIRLVDGTEHRGDVVVSAADGHTTIFDMLEGKYINDVIRGYYDNLTLYPPLIYIGFGIDRTFDDIPPSAEGLTFPLEDPLIIAGQEHKILTVQIYNFDPTLAPEGKTVIRVMLYTDYDYWEQLYKDPERYKAEKEKISNSIISILDKRFPGLANQVEMRDVATPMTWVRYTGNWRGAYEGWVRDMKAPMLMKKTLPGLDNFYMAGQWVNPGGGMPAAVMSGRHTIQMICKKDKKRFVTSTP